VSTFYGIDAGTLRTEIAGLYTNMQAHTPSNVTFKVENTGDVIEATNGDLVDSWTAGTETSLPCSGTTGPYAAPCGASVAWKTSVIADGSRIVGRTYLVPLIPNDYGSDGTLLDTFKTFLEAATAGVVTGAADNFVVWHRPFAGRLAGVDRLGRPFTAKAAHAGSFAFVTSRSVPDKVAVLKSRRD